MRILAIIAATGIAALVMGCEKRSPDRADGDAAEFQKRLQLQLINAQPGDIVEIPAGIHEINRGLSLNVSGVTVRGAPNRRRPCYLRQNRRRKGSTHAHSHHK